MMIITDLARRALPEKQCRSKNDNDTIDNDDDADNENTDNDYNDDDGTDYDDYRPREGSSVRETASFQTGRSPTMFIPVLDR